MMSKQCPKWKDVLAAIRCSLFAFFIGIGLGVLLLTGGSMGLESWAGLIAGMVLFLCAEVAFYARRILEKLEDLEKKQIDSTTPPNT